MLLLRILIALVCTCQCANNAPLELTDTVVPHRRRTARTDVAAPTASRRSRTNAAHPTPPLLPDLVISRKPFIWQLVPAGFLFYFLKSTWNFGEISSLIYAISATVAIYLVGMTHFERPFLTLIRQPGWKFSFNAACIYSAVKASCYIATVIYGIFKNVFELIQEILLSPETPWPVWALTLLFLLYSYVNTPNQQ